MEKKDINTFLASFPNKTAKQMRTVRNNLNNRITSFEAEMKLGKSLPALSASHVLSGFDLKDCRILLEAAKKIIKTQK